MSTLQGDLAHRPSPHHSSPSGSAMPQEESAGTPKMSTLQSVRPKIKKHCKVTWNKTHRSTRKLISHQITSGKELGDIEHSSPIPHKKSGNPRHVTGQGSLYINSPIHSDVSRSRSVSPPRSRSVSPSQSPPQEEFTKEQGSPRHITEQGRVRRRYNAGPRLRKTERGRVKHRYSPIPSDSDVSSPTLSTSSSPSQEEFTIEEGEEEGWKADLCHAICVNSWNDAKAILDQNPQGYEAVINKKGRTALHVAAMFGHVTIVDELLKLLSPEFLTTLDSDGYTALALACWYSKSTEVAKALVNKNSHILGIPHEHNDLPVINAFLNNYIEMGRYLYSVTPLEFLTGAHGSNLLRYCFKAQCIDIALHLLQQREELLLVPNDEGRTPIHDIASLNTAILSPSELVFWKRWIYNYINKPSAIAINQVCVDIQQKDRSQEDKAKLAQPGHGLLSRLITSAYDFVGVKKIKELKLQHAQADVLLGLVCKNARKAYQKGFIYGALKLAAKEGNAEFVLQVSSKIPEIFTRHTFLSIFSAALHNRHAEVFNLIHGLQFKNVVITSMFSDEEDNMLHKAARLAPKRILNRIYAPTLQMQKELQWFKEVESLMSPEQKGSRNISGKTGEEIFRETHRNLMKEGEKWIKNTASSCSVVSTLILTIMFATAFSVPRVNDQNLGYPLLIKQPVFQVFIFTTILSLLFSTASVLMFLAILTSQYSEDKFLKSLPTKLIWGLFFLFFSIVFMMIAFLSTIDLMMKHTHYSWGIFPISILASLPIFLFLLSQFPLLLHTYVSTYGNIFDRKVKSWP